MKAATQQLGTPTYHEPTFRTYPPERMMGPNGVMLTMQLCEEYVGGRWERFYSCRTPKALRQAVRGQ
jgi:hypothetical protein